MAGGTGCPRRKFCLGLKVGRRRKKLGTGGRGIFRRAVGGMRRPGVAVGMEQGASAARTAGVPALATVLRLVCFGQVQ